MLIFLHVFWRFEEVWGANYPTPSNCPIWSSQKATGSNTAKWRVTPTPSSHLPTLPPIDILWWGWCCRLIRRNRRFWWDWGGWHRDLVLVRGGVGIAFVLLWICGWILGRRLMRFCGGLLGRLWNRCGLFLWLLGGNQRATALGFDFAVFSV